MIAAAMERGYGDAPSLEAKLGMFQKRGLVGHSIGRDGQRGDGVWHDVQAWLWLQPLERCAEGLRPSALTNLPVGLWLLGMDGGGIGLRQVQRAFGTWINADGRRTPPSGSRSVLSRAIDRQLDGFEHQDSSRETRRAMRELLIRQNLAPSDRVRDDDLFKGRVADLVGGPKPDADARALAEIIAGGVAFTIAAKAHAKLLVTERDDVVRLWEWVRAGIQANPPRDPLEFAPNSCAHAAMVLGATIDAQLTGRDMGFEPPPPKVRIKAPSR
jgi:hypothetical protein